jgi:outer membrane immunogenic protein
MPNDTDLALLALRWPSMHIRQLSAAALVSFTAGLGGSAFAADTLPPAAVAVTTPVAATHDWTGFYLGANFGYGVGRNRSKERELNLPNSVFNDEKFDLSPDGLLGGLQGGANWQIARWVFGVEADFQWRNRSDASFCGNGCSTFQGTLVTQQMPWFGTARGRFGYAADPALFYVTGGFAIARVETAVAPYDGPPPRYFPFGVNTTKSGWTAGAGVEAVISGPWTAKVEYLYLDLGDVAAGGHTGGPVSAGQISSDVRSHVFRVGLNYHLGAQSGAETAPAIYQKAPAPIAVRDWSGLYAGINAGYGVAHNATSAGIADNFGVPIENFIQSPAGGLGGVQAGYNWQRGHWLIGVESDLQYAAQTSSSCMLGCVPSDSLTVDQTIRWFGTTRARVGLTPGSSLFYLTAGLAYGAVDTAGQLGISIRKPLQPYGGTRTNSGWAVGGGIETPIAANWSIKGEYLYMDLGHVKHSATGFDGEGFPATAGLDSQIQDHIFRAGLNYKLD